MDNAMHTDVMEQGRQAALVADPFLETYQTTRRLVLGFAVIALGIVIAGFWNYHLVDGFGRDFVAGRAIGDTGALAGSYVE
jgi:hypothetical protein